MEGQRLVLHCSVAVGTGSISFSWHREGSAEVLGRDRSYEIPSTQQSDNGQYYCMASNGDSPARSLLVKVTVVGEQHHGMVGAHVGIGTTGLILRGHRGCPDAAEVGGDPK